MRDSVSRRSTDRVLAALVRSIVRIFFREIEVVGAEGIPHDTPLVLVANHSNSLIDPILILGALGHLRPRFLAKSTLWSHPFVGPWLRIAGAVPVYRRHDPGVDVRRNLETFVRCHEVLAAGGTVALFPEGRSHDHPHRLPLKTGAARIVLEAEARHEGLGTRIVPIGLTFEAKDRFRSRVLAVVGEPLDPAPEAALQRENARGAVRQLTERIAAALESVTVSYASWDEARMIDRAVTLHHRSAGGPPETGDRGADRLGLSRRFELRKAFLQGYQTLKTAAPERVTALAEAVARYDGTLRSLSLRDEDVWRRDEDDAGRRSAQSHAGALLWQLPLAVAGVALNIVPFKLPGWTARRLSRTSDEPATYKVMVALLAFPLFWALEVAAAGLLGGALWALGVAVAAPAGGLAALRLMEERGPWREQARLRFKPSAVFVEELRRQREALCRELAALVAEYGSTARGRAS